MITKLVPGEIKRAIGLIAEFCNGINTVQELPILLNQINEGYNWTNGITEILAPEGLTNKNVLQRELTVPDFDVTLGVGGKLTLKIKVNEYFYLINNCESYLFRDPRPTVLKTPYLRGVKWVGKLGDDAVICSSEVSHCDQSVSKVHLVAKDIFINHEHFEVDVMGLTVIKDSKVLLTSEDAGIWAIESNDEVLIKLALKEHLARLYQHAVPEDILSVETMQRCYSLSLTSVNFGPDGEYRANVRTVHISTETYSAFSEKALELLKSDK